MNPPQTLLEELLTSAKTGNLPELQNQLSHLEIEPDLPTTLTDHFKQNSATISQWLEVIEVLQGPNGEPARVGPTHFIHHRLLTRATRWNQVGTVRYFLDDLEWSVTPTAMRWALAAQSYDVMEYFMSRGWDISQPMLSNLAPILWEFVTNEPRVRWCLEHGADPNVRNLGKDLGIPSSAGRFASVSILQLLAAHGADFVRRNALHRAATRDQRVEVLQWLLDEGGVPINQREWEYDAVLFNNWRSNGLGTALHCAVQYSALECVRFLLGKGIDVGLPDTRGHTARESGLNINREEAVAILDGWEAQKL